MVRKPSFDSNGMKKGEWSGEEDEKLRNYIMRYGHWNWRLLPKYAGLARCGKSCRLRWVNYLKPGVKRGNFSAQEQDLVVELHAKLGNKWSAIAAKLPGRSDNEIKNFWHTRIEKRRQNPPAKANNTKGASQITLCKTTHQNETISFDTKSSDIILKSDDTAYSQINCLPPLQEEDFPKCNYNEHSITSFVHESVHDDFWPDEYLVSNWKCENGYTNSDVEGFYDPGLDQYFDYGMDLFNFS